MLLVISAGVPKFKAVALAESCRIGATPLPLSAMAVGEFEALLTRAKLLVGLPVDVGVKLGVKKVFHSPISPDHLSGEHQIIGQGFTGGLSWYRRVTGVGKFGAQSGKPEKQRRETRGIQFRKILGWPNSLRR
jgi:hypothetical protein